MIKKEKGQHIIKLTDYGKSKSFITLPNYGNAYGVGIDFYNVPEILKGEQALVKKKFNKLISKSKNNELDDLIKRLLEKDTSKVLKWDEYLNNEFFKDKYKNKIILIYEKKSNEYYANNIFGKKFVDNNKGKIELKINGEKNKLSRYGLKERENKIKIIIKDKKTNLEYMLYKCNSLKNIEEFKFLDAKEINNFANMFNGCESLSNIKGLEKWNASNGNDFYKIFYECKSLLDLKGLKNEMFQMEIMFFGLLFNKKYKIIKLYSINIIRIFFELNIWLYSFLSPFKYSPSNSNSPS